MEIKILNRTISLLLVLIVTAVSAFVLEKKNTPNILSGEIEKIKKTIHSSIGWAKDKDIKLLYSVIANDSSFLEVHPDKSVVIGFEEFKKAEKFWLHPDFKAIRYEIKDLRITISNSGEVAWWYCMLDDINEWKGQPANWENTRWTGVLEKREGNWVIAQQHFSFASKEN